MRKLSVYTYHTYTHTCICTYVCTYCTFAWWEPADIHTSGCNSESKATGWVRWACSKKEWRIPTSTLHELVQSKQSSLLNGSWACEFSTDTSTSPPSVVLLAQITSRFSFLTSKGLSSSSIIRFTLDTRTVWALLKFRGRSCWRRRKARSNTLYNIRHNSRIQLAWHSTPQSSFL